MTRFSRRAFTKLLVTAPPSLYLAGLVEKADLLQAQSECAIPNRIAGYTLTDEDKILASKFLAAQDKSLSTLRERDLANGLAPSFVPVSLRLEKREGKSR